MRQGVAYAELAKSGGQVRGQRHCTEGKELFTGIAEPVTHRAGGLHVRVGEREKKWRAFETVDQGQTQKGKKEQYLETGWNVDIICRPHLQQHSTQQHNKLHSQTRTIDVEIHNNTRERGGRAC